MCLRLSVQRPEQRLEALRTGDFFQQFRVLRHTDYLLIDPYQQTVVLLRLLGRNCHQE